MIVCVTPNVAIDRTMIVPNYGAGGVFRPQQSVVAAGGKGINVARAVSILEGSPLCAGFLGGFSGQAIVKMVEAEGFASHWTMLKQGETRTCFILVDPEKGLTSVVNDAGPTVTDADWRQLDTDLQKATQSAQSLCFCGSLPPGTTADALCAVLESLVASGKSVWVDSSGLALETAAEVRGVHLKINDEEAAAYLKTPVEDVQQAAERLFEQTQAPVIITLGERGALYHDANTRLIVRPPKIQVVSAVGSGDSFLAGLLVARERGQAPADAMRYAVAAGSANALSIGGAQFDMADVTRFFSEAEVQEL